MCEYLGPGSSRLRHYDRQGWTFHGKGMWFEQELSQVKRTSVGLRWSSLDLQSVGLMELLESNFFGLAVLPSPYGLLMRQMYLTTCTYWHVTGRACDGDSGGQLQFWPPELLPRF